MITKHSVSNEILTRGEKDTAPPPLSINKEGKNFHKGTETGSGDRNKRWFVFDALSPALPVPTNTNSKNNKKDDAGFSFGAALLAPPNYWGVGGFYLGLYSSSIIHRSTGSIYREKVTEEKKEESSSAPAAAFLLWCVGGDDTCGYCLRWSNHIHDQVLLWGSFSFRSGMYRPCGRGGKAFQPSARHCPPPHWKWWGTAGPYYDI